MAFSLIWSNVHLSPTTTRKVSKIATSNVKEKQQVISKVFHVYSRRLWDSMQSHKNRVVPRRLQFFSQFIDPASGQVGTLLLLRSDRRMEISLPKLAGLIFFFFFLRRLKVANNVESYSNELASLSSANEPSSVLRSLLALGGWVASPAGQTGLSVCILKNPSGCTETL